MSAIAHRPAQHAHRAVGAVLIAFVAGVVITAGLAAGTSTDRPMPTPTPTPGPSPVAAVTHFGL